MRGSVRAEGGKKAKRKKLLVELTRTDKKSRLSLPLSIVLSPPSFLLSYFFLYIENTTLTRTEKGR